MANKTIYISSCEQDIKYAKWIAAILEVNGFSTTLPNYSRYDIEQATALLDSSDAVLILCSSKMKASDYQSKETDHAFNQGKPLISILIDKCDIDDQYNYYLSGCRRFELYKNRAKIMRLLVAEIKKATQNEENSYQEYKVSKYNVDLLSESDIDKILSEDGKQISFFARISPFSRLYTVNPTVKFALKCYTFIFTPIFALVFLASIANIIDSIKYPTLHNLKSGIPYVLILIFSIPLGLILWNASYYPSLLIAKLKIKNRFLIILSVMISLWITLAILSSF